jgi:hypothetical protein
MRQKKVAPACSAESPPTPPEWSQLLVDAVSKPGVISKAYSRFWNYSVGNQLLALWQCVFRKLEVGPIHTFLGWKDLGRHVRKGEKAITLCMPVTVKRRIDAQKLDPALVRVGDRAERQITGPGGAVQENEVSVPVTLFVYKPHWFVLCQTEGADYVPTELPAWSQEHALATLDVALENFRHPDGNCQGYAHERIVSVSPIATMPHKTLFHELAHVLLGHTEEGALEDHDQTPRNLREVEAECVALICCESLNLPGAEFSRGYVQRWLGGETIPERSAQKIFKAADQLLKAGRPPSKANGSDHA